MKYPPHLLRLIEVLKHLPGVGTKSAERFAFEMIGWTRGKLSEMAAIIHATPDQIQHCSECGCLAGNDGCLFCAKSATRLPALCVVGNSRDVFAIEGTQEYKGLYHVLGGLLSPLQGKGPETLQIEKLKDRIRRLGVSEVILALDSTLEGDATALYLKQELEPLQVGVSRLAFGLPMGSSLDYVDGGTLARALSARGRF